VPPYDLSDRPSELQHAIARHVRVTRGVRCDPSQVVVLSSIQQAFQLTSRLLLEAGDAVAMEEPHRVGARNAFLAHGLRVHAIPSDEQAMRVDLLPDSPAPRLVYVSPSHLWPTGAVLPLDRRLRLLEWAHTHDAWILENDHNTEFSAMRTPVMSLQGLDAAERVLYIGNFSRLISPDPNVAYLIVPPHVADAFRAARNLDGYGPSLLDVDVLARFLNEGHLETQLRRVARRLAPLRDELRDALRESPHHPFDVRDMPGGLHLHVVRSRGTSHSR
jgi:GntR family transcriptional regulator/MocR family aminotransferase